MRELITPINNRVFDLFNKVRSIQLVILLSILMLPWKASAQVADYVYTQSLGTYTPITGGIVVGTATTDDQRFVDPATPVGGTVLTGPGLPIGFTFSYGGSDYDRFAINANGWISLGQSSLTPSVNIQSSSSYTAISSASTATPNILQRRIVAFGRDLQSQAGAEIRYETVGTAPSRTLVVQWTNYRKFIATGDSISFQIRLNESDSSINIVYDAPTLNATSTTGEVGLRGISNTDFNNRTTTTDWTASTAGAINTASMTLSQTVFPPSGLSFNWSPPPPASLDASAISLVLGSPTGCAPNTESIQAWIKNTGPNTINFSVDTLKINVNVTGPTPQTFLSVINTGTLAVGDSALYPVTSSLNLASPGVYNISGNLSLIGDGLAGNNNFPAISRTKAFTVNSQYYAGFDQSTTIPTELSVVGYTATTVAGFSASAPRAIRRNHFSVGTQSGSVTLPVINNIPAGLDFRFNYSIREFSSPQPASTTFGPILVQASTDCGQSFTTIDSVVVSNHTPTTAFTLKSVNIASFVGQNVQFRIASEWGGVGDYYVTLDDIGVYSTVLPAFSLLSPPAGTTLNVQGNPGTVVNINWQRTTNITNPVVNYTWLLDAPTGNFSNPLLSIPANNSGLDTALTLTYLAIDNALATLNVNVGDTVDAKWTVRAIRGTDTLFATTPFDLTIIRGGLQSSLTAFSLLTPPNGASVNIIGDANTAVPTISWQRSVEQFGAAVTYTWLLDALTGDFTAPLAAIPSGNGGSDTTLNLNFGQVDALLASLNVAKGTTLNLKWTVRASSSLVDSLATNVHTINITRGGLIPSLFKGPVPSITGGSSGLGRAPVTQALFHRASSVYTPAEVSAVLVAGDTLKSIGFDITTAAAAAVSGNIKVYLVNSTDVTFARSTTWADLITLPTPMTLVYDGPLTIPNSIGYYDINFTIPFVYSGDGLYWAFEWAITAPVSTTASYRCNTTGVTNGSRNINGTTLGATLTSSSSFRPVNRYSVSRAGNDLRIAEVYAFGKNDPLSVNPFTVNALVINEGSQVVNNRVVRLNITGTNSAIDSTTVTLFSGDTAFVAFNGINTTTNGNDVVTISVPADDVLSNNSRSFSSEVIDGVLAYANDGPASSAVGFNTGAGILVAKHTFNIPRSLTGLQMYIGSNAASIGKTVFGVLLNDQDSIIGRTSDVVLTAGDTASWVTFNFANPIVRDALSTFSVGLAQTAGTPGYFPMGIQPEAPVRPNTYFFRGNLADTGDMVPSALGRYMIRVLTTDTGSFVCSVPSNIVSSNVTANTATIDWTENGTATNWQVQYGVTGFSLGSGTIVTTSTKPQALSGLTPVTSYQVYVRSICSPGDTSAWSGAATFTTSCATFPLSFTETFESNSASLPCWTLGAGWATQPVSGFGVGSQSIRYNFYSIAAGTRADALSATFAPTPAGHRLSFDHAYATFATEVDSLIIYTSTNNGASWNLLIGLAGGTTGPLNTFGGSGATGLVNFVPTAAQWSTFNTPIPAGVNRVRFEAVSAFGNNLFIDNVKVEPLPSCVVPTGLASTAITNNSATLNWTTTAANSQVEWGINGFTQGSGTIVNVAGTTTNLTGLIVGTTYQFYVRSICAPGDTSNWSAVASFTTLCTTPATLPYTENFDGVTAPAIPGCITLQNGVAPWFISNGTGLPVTGPAVSFPSTPNAMVTVWNTTQASNSWFFTRSLNLQAGETYSLKFTYIAPGFANGENLRVTLGTTPNSASVIDTLWQETGLLDSVLTPELVDTIFTVPSNGIYNIGFQTFSPADEFLIAIDNIIIDIVSGLGANKTILGLSLFPNPSTGVFNLKFDNALPNAAISITDLTGKVVMEKNLHGDGGMVDTTIDLTPFAQGMYFARIINGDTVQTIKLKKD